jgi:hypothetical protein
MGEEWFAEQDERTQEAVLGTEASRTYCFGKVRLSDFVGVKESEKWGTVRYSKSLKTVIVDTGNNKERKASVPSCTQIQSDQKHIVHQIFEITGLRSRWSGNVVFGTQLRPDGLPVYAGVKEWSCDINLHKSILDTMRRYSTGIHEGFHSVSMGLDPIAYQVFQGYEEAVVEQCTRLFRERILEGLKLTEPLDKRISYDDYIAEMERLRYWSGKEAEDFYLGLLKTPLAEREETVVKWIGMVDSGVDKDWLHRTIAEPLRKLKEPM